MRINKADTLFGFLQMIVKPISLIAIAVQIVLAPVGVKPHKIAVLFRIETNAVVVAVIIEGTVGSGITVRGHSLSAGQNIAVTQSVYHIVKFSLKFIGFQVFSEIVPSRPKLVPVRTEVRSA